MNITNNGIYECLCSDLGMKLSIGYDMQQIGDLRKEFLRLSEAKFVDNLFDVWARKFEDLFSYRVTYKDFERPAVFRDIYQVLSFPLKIRKPHTNAQEQKYVLSFLETEKATKSWRRNANNNVTRLARYLIRCATPDCNLDHENVSRFCRHGPGATFNKEVGSDKNFFLFPPSSLLKSFPFDCFYANAGIWSDIGINARVDTPDRTITSRLTLVPKDFKGPRGVFVSPKEAVFCQLGIDGALKDWARRCWLSQCYDPTDQAPSQELAYVGSYNGMWSTLDLSDASDRIPLSFVAYLFKRKDYLMLARTRPSYVRLPSGSLHKLGMFAPMGDGKTFPILTIVCSALSLASILDANGFLAARPPNMEVVQEYAKALRVFGDDIIVRSEYYAGVCKALEDHNLKVNKQKSFNQGSFREACGMDAYMGTDVTPLRQKEDLDDRPDLLNLVEFHNRIKLRYPRLVRTISYLSSFIENISPDIGITTRCDINPTCLQTDHLHFMQRVRRKTWRWDPYLQRYEFRVITRLPSYRYEDSLDPRWDLSYSLFPKIRIDNPEMTVRYEEEIIPSIGSPSSSRFIDSVLRRLGFRVPAVWRSSFRFSWVWAV